MLCLTTVVRTRLTEMNIVSFNVCLKSWIKTFIIIIIIINHKAFTKYTKLLV